MSRHLDNRENVLISTHTHNDRGTSVAATELALLAGADRVEGTLLSNGERTGNVDIITLALNMYTQGLDPELDFSDITTVLDIVERCTDMKTHERHPYVGELVYTAFSGSHQDAINKGLAYQRTKEGEFWEVPYLPIDPDDLGRNYEGIIRINSQSGKGGVAYLLEEKYGYSLPKKMHPEIGKIIQGITDVQGRELELEEILDIFKKTYLEPKAHLELVDFTAKTNKDHTVSCKLTYKIDGKKVKSEGTGNGPIDACKHALEKEYPNAFTLTDYTQHTHGEKSSAESISYIQVQTQQHETFYGVGADTNISLASVKAIFSALNRAYTA
jgi:2-isopropylmalate synthase